MRSYVFRVIVSGKVCKFALWNVDLAFTAFEVDIYSATDGLTIGGRPEDVANSVAFREWVRRHLDLFGIASVCKRNQELSARERIEVVFDIAFDLLAIPDLTSFALCMNL